MNSCFFIVGAENGVANCLAGAIMCFVKESYTYKLRSGFSADPSHDGVFWAAAGAVPGIEGRLEYHPVAQ